MEERKKQATMVLQSSSMENLPLHILMEIISRLPIKTVMAVRCVSKSLLSLISDSHFQILHSTRAPTELWYSATGKSSTTLCIAKYVFVDNSLTAVDTEKNSAVFELPRFSVRSETYCNFGATETVVAFVNSCCGLVCYKGPSGNRFVVICNPITLEYVMFPCPSRMDKTLKTAYMCYGLGFSHKDNRFKLLRLIDRKYVDTDSGEEETRRVGEVYTFGESGSSWKTVANCPHVLMIGVEEGIFHEGALHWYCTSDDAIVTFDFDTELFGKLVAPPRMGARICSKVGWSLDMGVFENCIYTTGCVGDYVDIWALKEYGRDSWVKIFSIQKDVKSFSESYKPFEYLPNGQVLMFKKHAGIVCFNPDTGSVKRVGGLRDGDVTVFIRPSLVSLKVSLGDNVKVHSVKTWREAKAQGCGRPSTSGVSEELIVEVVAKRTKKLEAYFTAELERRRQEVKEEDWQPFAEIEARMKEKLDAILPEMMKKFFPGGRPPGV